MSAGVLLLQRVQVIGRHPAGPELWTPPAVAAVAAAAGAAGASAATIGAVTSVELSAISLPTVTTYQHRLATRDCLRGRAAP